MDAIAGLFRFLIFLAIVLAGIALFSYNKLQRLSQNIQERSSNVQVAVSRKLSLVNQLIDVVKNFQESEQFTHLKISQDSTAASLTSAYQQSGTVLTSIRGLADRFPNLKNSEQYHRLIDSIQTCEADIQQQRLWYNASVKEYNSVCLSIPTVFVARTIGFGKAPYLEFDHSGVTDVTSLKEFKTDDGERLQQLLTGAGSGIAGATRVIASQAAQTGKMIADKAKEKSAERSAEKPRVPLSGSYFYLVPGGVPQGPTSLSQIQAQVAAGTLDRAVLIAEPGTSDWKPLPPPND